MIGFLHTSIITNLWHRSIINKKKTEVKDWKYPLLSQPLILFFKSGNLILQLIGVSLCIENTELLLRCMHQEEMNKIESSNCLRTAGRTKIDTSINRTRTSIELACFLARERAADSRFLIILFCLLSTVFFAMSSTGPLFLLGVCGLNGDELAPSPSWYTASTMAKGWGSCRPP